jgi:4-hydroxythreonine-4-phosphate dehydrogenase
LSKSKSRLAVTPGEPAGIGPDVCLQAFQQNSQQAELIYFADPDLIQNRADDLRIEISINDVTSAPFDVTRFNVHPVKTSAVVVPGTANTENAGYVIETLEQALLSCQAGETGGIVTGPVNKSIINDAGIPFSGHTEWFADKTGTPRVVMMLAGETLRVALATTHLPLSKVSEAITQTSLMEVASILHAELVKKFGIDHPKILVCGLNPHAGENGHLGREEIDTIIPVIKALQKQGLDFEGPLPADTLFTPDNLERADAVLAMYHDQGLPVLKYVTFGQGVNITLGLPIVRTSVDHGTAFDLAGSGRSDCSSLVAAVRCAVELCA